MSDSLSAAAAALGLPESIVSRSAASRAAATGRSVEEVLAAWAEGKEIPDSPAAATTETAPNPPPGPVTESYEPAATEPETQPAASVGPGSTVAVGRSPTPAEVTPAEAAHLAEVITVPTAGLRERTNFRMPKWLLAVLVIAPVFALLTLGGSATGTCGDATQLSTDVITGQIVNCDGSPFTGSGVGGGSVDYIAQGETIYLGSGVTGVNCSGCHGAAGAGSSAFPALNNVTNTFGACADHLHWVRVGSAGLQGEGSSTYGDGAKPIKGGMPGHSSLTDLQLASVVAFERVRFGGADLATTLTDCGLVTASAPADTGTTVPATS